MDLFGIGGPELLVLLFLAGVVLGPRRLVKLAREAGKLIHKIRALTADLTDQLNRELDLLDDAQANSPTGAGPGEGTKAELPEAYRRFQQDFPGEGDVDDLPAGTPPGNGQSGKGSQEGLTPSTVEAAEPQPEALPLDPRDHSP